MSTQENGDVVPPDLVEEIARAGGNISTEAWWVGKSGPDGLFLSVEAIDWVDAVANGETPEPRAGTATQRPDLPQSA